MHICVYIFLLTNKHDTDNRRQHRNSVLNIKMLCFQFSRKCVICILADLLVQLYKTRKRACKRVKILFQSKEGKTKTPSRFEITLQLIGKASKRQHKIQKWLACYFIPGCT